MKATSAKVEGELAEAEQAEAEAELEALTTRSVTPAPKPKRSLPTLATRPPASRQT